MTTLMLTSASTWIVHILQTRVSLQRIETFLNEEEVGPQVSTLKEDTEGEFRDTMELGLRNASFKWNAVDEKESGDDADQKAKDNDKKLKSSPERDIEAAISDSVRSDISQTGTDAGSEDHVFELRDISVTFPDGVLTVVTGPTASGKTALLVRISLSVTAQFLFYILVHSSLCLER